MSDAKHSKSEPLPEPRRGARSAANKPGPGVGGMRTRIEGSAIQYAVQLHDAGEHIPTLLDLACREMDIACAEGRHFTLAGGRCIWCGREA